MICEMVFVLARVRYMIVNTELIHSCVCAVRELFEERVMAFDEREKKTVHTHI